MKTTFQKKVNFSPQVKFIRSYYLTIFQVPVAATLAFLAVNILLFYFFKLIFWNWNIGQIIYVFSFPSTLVSSTYMSIISIRSIGSKGYVVLWLNFWIFSWGTILFQLFVIWIFEAEEQNQFTIIKLTKNPFPAGKICKEGFPKVLVFEQNHILVTLRWGWRTFPWSRKCLSVVLK